MSSLWWYGGIVTVLAFDFDGTLATDQGELCSGVEETLNSYRDEQDVQIVVATGSRLSRVRPEVRDFADAVVAENGGVIDWGDNIEIGNAVPEVIQEIVDFHFPPEQVDHRRTMTFLRCHPDAFPEEFVPEVTQRGYEVVRNNETAAVKHPDYSKAQGLRHAMAYRHSQHRIIAAGDSANDLDLLKFADVALTPANGDEQINTQSVGEPLYRGEESFWYGIEDKLHELVMEG